MYWNLTEKERFETALALAAEDTKLLQLFLKDFFTPKEIQFFEQRLLAMCMIKDVITYEQIHQMTGLSANTISRLTKTMKDRNCGVQKILQKMKDRHGVRKYFE